MSSKPFIEKLKPFLGPFVFISASLLVFFFAAFTIVLFRTKGSNKITMPKLIGRSYLEVHNELSRLRLKIKLENEWYPDKMHGTILSQLVGFFLHKSLSMESWYPSKQERKKSFFMSFSMQ